MLYDKAGNAYDWDHDVDVTSYVRPMIKTVVQSTNYHGDDFHEEEFTEPADYLIAMPRADLFDEPPVAKVHAEIAEARAKLADDINAAKAELKDIKVEARRAELELTRAKSQLDRWMAEHQVFMDLGRMLDGETLYPLHVQKSHYHDGRDVPLVPKWEDVDFMTVKFNNMAKENPWTIVRKRFDRYETPVRVFRSEAERDETVRNEFAETCDKFRAKPNFSDEGKTYSTRLDFGTLTRWVKHHPFLSIPDDIEAMKRDHEAEVRAKKKEKLAEQLAALGND